MFCAKNSTDMPKSTSNRFVQNAAQFSFSPPLGKRPNNIEEYEGLSLADTSFSPGDSTRPLKKQMDMPPSSIGHWGQYETQYSPFDWILRAAFASREFGGFT